LGLSIHSTVPLRRRSDPFVSLCILHAREALNSLEIFETRARWIPDHRKQVHHSRLSTTWFPALRQYKSELWPTKDFGTSRSGTAAAVSN